MLIWIKYLFIYLFIIDIKFEFIFDFKERKRAVDLNIDDPILPNFEATTESYHCALVETLKHAKQNNPNNKVHVFVASHNENTVQFALKTFVSFLFLI